MRREIGNADAVLTMHAAFSLPGMLMVAEEDGLRLLLAQIDAGGRLAHSEVGVATPAGWRLAAAATVVHDEMGQRLPTLAFATGEPGQFAVAVLDSIKERLVLVRHSGVDLAPPPSGAAAPLCAGDVSLLARTQCELVDGPTLCLVVTGDTTASFAHLRFGPPPQPWGQPPPEPTRMARWGLGDRVLCGLPTRSGAPPSVVVARRPAGLPATIELLLLPAGGAPAIPYAVIVVGGAADTATCGHASLAPPCQAATAAGGAAGSEEMAPCDGCGPRGGVAGLAEGWGVRLWVGCSSGGVYRYTIPHAVLWAASAALGGEGGDGAAESAAVSGAPVTGGAAANGSAVNGAAVNGASVDRAFLVARVPMPVEMSVLLRGPARRVEPVAWSWGADEAVAVECDGAAGGSGGSKRGGGGGGRGAGVAAACGPATDSYVHIFSGAGEPLRTAWGVCAWGVVDLTRTAIPQLLLWGCGAGVRRGATGGGWLPAGCTLVAMGHTWVEAGELAPLLAQPTMGPGHTIATPPGAAHRGDAPGAAAAQLSAGPSGGCSAEAASCPVFDASTRGLRLYAIAQALGARATAGQAQVRPVTPENLPPPLDSPLRPRRSAVAASAPPARSTDVALAQRSHSFSLPSAPLPLFSARSHHSYSLHLCHPPTIRATPHAFVSILRDKPNAH